MAEWDSTPERELYILEQNKFDAEEIILKQNTRYLVRVTEQNVNPSIINFDFDWYEHQNRN